MLRRAIAHKVHRAAPEGATGIKIDGVHFVIVSDGAMRVVTTVLDADAFNHGQQERP